MQPNGNLFHNWEKGQASVDGFLEDYSLFIQSAISLFEVSRDKEWLNVAKKMTNYTFNNFYDAKSGLFYFSEKSENSVVINYFQKEDNVLPASNSVMANNLHRLYLYSIQIGFREIRRSYFCSQQSKKLCCNRLLQCFFNDVVGKKNKHKNRKAIWFEYNFRSPGIFN